MSMCKVLPMSLCRTHLRTRMSGGLGAGVSDGPGYPIGIWWILRPLRLLVRQSVGHGLTRRRS